MVSRRDVALGAGLAVLGSSAVSAAGKAVSALSMPGPWTRTGALRRAGGVLAYATLGEPDAVRPPLVLLHKLGGWLSDWRQVAPALAQGRQVIAFDLPGHGRSRWDGAPPYLQSLGETSALLVGALDEMGIDRADLAGTSLGGCIAVVMAALWPERLRRVAIVSSALRERRSLAEISRLVDRGQGQLFDRNGDPLPNTAKQLVDTFGIVHAGPISVEGNASRRAAGRWIQPSERGVGACDLVAGLRRITAPTLLVYGALDKAYLKFRPAAEAALRDCRTEVVLDSGAFVIQDNPLPTAAVLKRFFDSV
jgi:pimeloyl-ACP methyl ester carboxylesterase